MFKYIFSKEHRISQLITQRKNLDDWKFDPTPLKGNEYARHVPTNLFILKYDNYGFGLTVDYGQEGSLEYPLSLLDKFRLLWLYHRLRYDYLMQLHHKRFAKILADGILQEVNRPSIVRELFKDLREDTNNE